MQNLWSYLSFRAKGIAGVDNGPDMWNSPSWGRLATRCDSVNASAQQKIGDGPCRGMIRSIVVCRSQFGSHGKGNQSEGSKEAGCLKLLELRSQRLIAAI